MPNLDPAPSSLGLHSPAIGPWFADSGLSLPLPPDGALAVSLTPTSDTAFLPPAAGLLTVRMSSSPRPRELAGLRDPDGAPAFSDDRLVFLFRLLPEVEARLAALSRVLPTLAGTVAATGDQPRRPVVRWFAIEFDQSGPDLAFALARVPTSLGPPTSGTDDEKAAWLGLRLQGSALSNLSTAMSALVRPRRDSSDLKRLVELASGATFRLWAFDARGRPLDPGAVARWWAFLAPAQQADNSLGFPNLWESSLQDTDKRTVNASDGLVMHLMNPFGGKPSDALVGRLDIGNATGSGLVRRRDGNTGALTVGFTTATGGQPDDLPVPRVAVGPDGRMGETLSLWETGPVNALLARDFAQVYALSVEEHLVGVPRRAPTGASAALTERAARQEHVRTRVNATRAARGGLRATTDEAAAALLEAMNSTDPVRVVAGTLDGAFGPIAFAALPDVDPPTSTPTITASALVGGGAAAGGTIADQRVLIELNYGVTTLTGAWVRAWPQGFNATRGEHTRLDGGAAPIDGTGRCRLVVTLATGDTTPSALMGLDLVVSTARGGRLVSDLRFARPLPVGGAMVAAGSAGATLLVCETATEHAGALPAGSVPSGSTVVALTSPNPSLVDPASIADTARPDASARRRLGSNATVQLTQPAYKKTPDGDSTTTLAGNGATVNRSTRTLATSWQAGTPLPGMERREVLVSRADTGAVGGTPPLARYHERLPHRLGHPGCPGAPDLHGTGVTLTGPAATDLAELARDRTVGSTISLITAAATALQRPTTPDSDSAWAAVLRTVAPGVEAEIGVEVLLGALGFQFGTTIDQIEQWLQSNLPGGGGISLSGGDAGSVLRALERRLLMAARGGQEGARSLLSAIGRAEDLIYIETPALDTLSFGPTDDTASLLGALTTRLDANPALRVVLCVPEKLHDAPKPLARVRDQGVAQAITQLQGGSRRERVAVFSPSAGMGRSLRLASTTVVVDDAWVMTGTTHLWRRGLTWDSSVAASLFDDRLSGGRPAEIRDFRRALVAGRLGLQVADAPEDGDDLVRSVQSLVARGGLGRLGTEGIPLPQDPADTTSGAFTEVDIWNPDGVPQGGFNVLTWFGGLLIGAYNDSFNGS